MTSLKNFILLLLPPNIDKDEELIVHYNLLSNNILLSKEFELGTNGNTFVVRSNTQRYVLKFYVASAANVLTDYYMLQEFDVAPCIYYIAQHKEYTIVIEKEYKIDLEKWLQSSPEMLPYTAFQCYLIFAQMLYFYGKFDMRFQFKHIMVSDNNANSLRWTGFATNSAIKDVSIQKRAFMTSVMSYLTSSLGSDIVSFLANNPEMKALLDSKFENRLFSSEHSFSDLTSISDSYFRDMMVNLSKSIDITSEVKNISLVNQANTTNNIKMISLNSNLSPKSTNILPNTSMEKSKSSVTPKVRIWLVKDLEVSPTNMDGDPEQCSCKDYIESIDSVHYNKSSAFKRKSKIDHSKRKCNVLEYVINEDFSINYLGVAEELGPDEDVSDYANKYVNEVVFIKIYYITKRKFIPLCDSCGCITKDYFLENSVSLKESDIKEERDSLSKLSSDDVDDLVYEVERKQIEFKFEDDESNTYKFLNFLANKQDE